MDISYHKVYLYDHVRQLLVADGNTCFLKDNGPMSKNPILCHKGIDNRIIFRALNPDRQPANISDNQQVYARIIDVNNHTVVLEKLCNTGPAKGLITFVLNSGDIADTAPGTYQLVLIRTEEFVVDAPGYYIEKPLYSDLNDNISMELEITEQAFKTALPSITLLPNDWTPDIFAPISGAPRPCFYTQRIPGGRVLNHKESVQSFSTYTENFTGILEIWGTLEESPSAYLNDTRWFKIYPSTMSQNVEYVGYTGTQAWTFSANFMWLKFRYFPSTDVVDPGKLSKLIVRT